MTSVLDESETVDVPLEYRDDRPPDQVLYAAMYGQCFIFDVVGPYVYHLNKEGQLASDLENFAIDPDDAGVYVWSGKPKRIDYPGGDCDVELDGERRHATSEEWSAYLKGEYPWDLQLWIK